MSDIVAIVSRVAVADQPAAVDAAQPQGESDFLLQHALPQLSLSAVGELNGSTLITEAADTPTDPLSAWLEDNLGLSAQFSPAPANPEPAALTGMTGQNPTAFLPQDTDAAEIPVPAGQVVAFVPGGHSRQAVTAQTVAEGEAGQQVSLPQATDAADAAPAPAVPAEAALPGGRPVATGQPAAVPRPDLPMNEPQPAAADADVPARQEMRRWNPPAAGRAPAAEHWDGNAKPASGAATPAAAGPAPDLPAQPVEANRERIATSLQPTETGGGNLDAMTFDPVIVDSRPMTPAGRATGPVGASPMPHHDPRPVIQQVTEAMVSTQGDRTEIALSPEELGRVRLIMSGPDRAHITIWAERPETLELVRRNADMLTQHLADAGVDTGSLDFRQDTPRGRSELDRTRSTQDEDSTLAPVELVRLQPAPLSDRRIDIRL